MQIKLQSGLGSRLWPRLWPRLWFVATVILVNGFSGAYAIESKADYAFLMDTTSGVVLFEKNANARMSPASLSKLMTILMVFEAIDEGTLLPDDEFIVSDNAWRRGGARSGGSTMFLNVHSKVSVRDLLRGVIIQSGNDACIVLAEGLAGSEERFAALMSARAGELGMTKSSFTNATGLPHPEHKTTARDLAILAAEVITKHARYYRLFAERDFTWNKITQINRNPLLYANIGVDGLKTGHTEESGYGLVASGEQNGRRLILVVNGLPSKRARAAEARRLMVWGFRSFKRQVLARATDEITHLPVWHGSDAKVAVQPQQRFDIIAPRSGRRKMVATVMYEKPVLAPIKKGDVLGKLKVTMPDLTPQEMSLVAANDVSRGNMIGRAFSSLAYFLLGE